MANVVTLSAYDQTTTPPCRQVNIGYNTVLNVLPFTAPNNAFVNSVVLTSMPTQTAIYCNESVAAIKAAVNAGGAPVFPVISGLLAYMDFTTPANVTTSGSEITQLTDPKTGKTWVQASGSLRPVYHLSGGSNNLPYASFVNQYLSGTLLTTNKTFSIFIVRLLNTTSQCGTITNGDSNNWGMSENEPYQSVNAPGVYFGNVTTNQILGTRSVQSKWEIYGSSNDGATCKGYNSAGQVFPMQTSLQPNTPSGSSYIGRNAGAGNFNGNIALAVVYDHQVTDTEAKSVINFMQVSLAVQTGSQLNTQGDSITFGLGLQVAQNYPNQIYTNILPSKYMYLTNVGVNGDTTGQMLARIQSAALNNYNSGVNNVCTFMGGRNDLTEFVSFATTTANIASYASQCKVQGWKFIMFTVLISTFETGTPANMPAWTALNNWILANSIGADAVIDVTQIAQSQDPSNLTYYQDGKHPTAALDALIGTYSYPTIQTFL